MRPEPSEPEPRAVATRARVGLLLFFVYVLLYGGFMGLVLLRPDMLSLRPFGGVNLAIAYGLGLIVAALLLAVAYMVACRWIDSGNRPDPR